MNRYKVRQVAFNLLLATFFASSADAQVVLIPHGDFENDFEKYVVVIASLMLLGIAVWQYYRGGELDYFKKQFRRMFKRHSR